MQFNRNPNKKIIHNKQKKYALSLLIDECISIKQKNQNLLIQLKTNFKSKQNLYFIYYFKLPHITPKQHSRIPYKKDQQRIAYTVINKQMNSSQSGKTQQFHNLQSTHIPPYGSMNDNVHPNQMRVSGRYGERTIPGSAFLAKTKNLDSAGQKAAYQNRNVSVYPGNCQQPHYQLPLYNYGQQCQPCNQQPYMLPVYYEQPIKVRQQWERPLDPNVHQQQWRFVKTQDKGGVVKYVTKDQQMVETKQSQWSGYYNHNQKPKPPIIIPQRQTKTCCSPALFAVLGFLALIGLILGLILLLNSHQTTTQKQVVISSETYVDPTPGKVSEQFSAVPIAPQPVIPIQPVTRPTSTQAITSQPTQTVQTSVPTTTVSTVETINTSPVSISYGYQSSQQQSSQQQSMNGVNYNNDYQVRPGTGFQTANDYTIEAQPTNVYPSYSSQETGRGNYDFRVPAGYTIDDTGMLVPA